MCSSSKLWKMKKTHYDCYFLYIRWHIQYNNTDGFRFQFQNEETKNQTHSFCSLYFSKLWFCCNVSLQNLTKCKNIKKKMHGQWKTAWALPFKLRSNYNTVASYLEKKSSLSSATKLSHESCCGISEKHLSVRTELDAQVVLTVWCGIDAQVGAECEQGQQGLVS